MPSVIPVILSGGSGTRLWPKSREAYPKQLHKIYGEYTMIQHTALRVAENNKLIAVCNESQRFMVADQLSQVCAVKPDIILEPMARNTAPAIAAAAVHALTIESDPVLVILPADHLIKDVEAFRVALDIAVQQAETGKVVAFGVVPTHPETGFGYIQSAPAQENGAPIVQFVEKPNVEKAKEYLANGSFTWNSGMFVCKAAVILEELQQNGADWLSLCRQSVDGAQKDLDFLRLEPASFSRCDNISIDYALMEKTKQAWVVPLSAGWSDVGSWDALWDASDKDANGNVVEGDVFIKNCKNTLVHSQDQLIAAIGIENVAVIESDDAILIVNKNQSQDVKEVVTWLKQNQRAEFQHHRQVHRPWGNFDSVDFGDRYQVKRITVKPGASLSSQKHFHRSEHWIVVSGTAEVQKDDETILLTENQSVYIPVGSKHRLTNPGKIPLQLIEVQSGSYLGEDDIVRFEDNYGREQEAVERETLRSKVINLKGE